VLAITAVLRAYHAENNLEQLLRRDSQILLFPIESPAPNTSAGASSTFVGNMGLPVHRWFRYSAGFSAEWAEDVISDAAKLGPVRVFDPFAGSATSLIAAECVGAESWGIDAHPFVARIASAKLAWRTDPDAYRRKITELLDVASRVTPAIDHYPKLIRSCYDDDTLSRLDALRLGWEAVRDESAASELAWLTLIAVLRKTSRAGTAQWQYILPKKQKRSPALPDTAFVECSRIIEHDMRGGQLVKGPRANFALADARTCAGVPRSFATLVVTSPPYPNNYDYADATRLEMSFMREIDGWGDLQETVRKHLVRSCSQHVPEKAVDLEEILSSPEVEPIRSELSEVCRKLAEVRETKGGRKTYHLMVACYFRDLAQVWRALRNVCDSPSRVCFVIGDSAPYGIYVPAVPWLGKLAIAAGFKSCTFDKTRDRNVKWKNRKHRVPLLEGRLWVEG
jgi:hypothetical protein